MKKVRVFCDIWLNSRLTVEQRVVLMTLYREMDKMNKVIVPSFNYLSRISGVTNSHNILKRLEAERILRIAQVEEGQYIHIRLKKGKVEKVKEEIFYIDGKWEKALMLTFYLIKDNKEYLWTDRGELSYLFKCSPRTITSKVKELQLKGLIIKERYLDKYKITPLI